MPKSPAERPDQTVSPQDCLVVGGGPAGLTAAIYLARFHLNVTVIDAGEGRCATIPLTRNHAGFPEGISGSDLLARMRQQAAQYGARLVCDEVIGIARQANGRFEATTISRTIEARTILLATGVINRRPPMIDDAIHDEAVAGGQLRYCPICDGFEVTDRRVAVLGTGQRGFAEASFLRSYTRQVTLVAPGRTHDLTTEQRNQLSAAQITLADQCSKIALSRDQIALTLPQGVVTFDSLYPALGSDIRSALARQVGASVSDEGCLMVDAQHRSDVDGLYAAGDVVLGLDQISHAMGGGGVAATTIRNDLARISPLRR